MRYKSFQYSLLKEAAEKVAIMDQLGQLWEGLGDDGRRAVIGGGIGAGIGGLGAGMAGMNPLMGALAGAGVGGLGGYTFGGGEGQNGWGNWLGFGNQYSPRSNEAGTGGEAWQPGFMDKATAYGQLHNDPDIARARGMIDNASRLTGWSPEQMGEGISNTLNAPRNVGGWLGQQFNNLANPQQASQADQPWALNTRPVSNPRFSPNATAFA